MTGQVAKRDWKAVRIVAGRVVDTSSASRSPGRHARSRIPSPASQATVLDFNSASSRALLKNGFIEEGTQRRAMLRHGKLHDLRAFARTRSGLDDVD